MAWQFHRDPKGKPAWSQSKLEPRKSKVQSNLLPVCGENVDEVLELLSALSDDKPLYLSAPVSDARSRTAFESESILRQRSFNREAHLADTRHSRYTWKDELFQKSHPGNLKSTKPIWSDRNITVPQFDASPCILHGSPVRDEVLPHGKRGRWEAPDCVFTKEAAFYSPLLPSKQQSCSDGGQVDAIDVGYSLACQKQNESLSTFQDLLESSWTSASLHRSMLDLDISEHVLTFVDSECFGDFSIPTSQESSVENNIDDPVSCKSKIACSIFQFRTGESGYTNSGTDSVSETDVARRRTELTNPLLQIEAQTNAQPHSQLVGSHSAIAAKLNSAGIRVALLPSESQAKSDSQAERGVLSVSACGPELYSDNAFCLHESLSQHSPRNRQTSPEEGLSKFYTKQPSRLSAQDKSLFDVRGLVLDEPGVTGKLSVPHLLSWHERLEMKENLCQTTLRGTNTEGVKNDTRRERRQGHGGAFTNTRGRQVGQNRGMLELSAPDLHYSLLDQRQMVRMGTLGGRTSRRGSDGYPGKRQKDVAKGKGPSSAHQSRQFREAPEIYVSCSVNIDERFLALYRFRLVQQCFRIWSRGLRSLREARLQRRRRALSTCLSALRCAVLTRHLQTGAAVERRTALLLAHCFHQWKACYEGRRDRHRDVSVDALRRRLVQPSDALVLRTAYCVWRRHVQGQQVLRAAIIHYNLAALYKHWLLWRRARFRWMSWMQQELQASLCLEARLQGRAMAVWSRAWHKARQATHQRRVCVLQAAWRGWRTRMEHRQQERLEQTNHGTSLRRKTLLLHFLQRWRGRADMRHRDRDRLLGITRRVVQSWRVRPHRSRRRRLSTRARQVFSSRTLAGAFGRWRQATALAGAARRQAEVVRHLLDRRRLRAAFTSWLRGSSARRGARLLCERIRGAQLSHCLWAWQSVIQRRSAGVDYCSRRDAQTARHCLQLWRRALGLHSTHKQLLICLLQNRQHTFLLRAKEQRETVAVASVSLRAQGTLDELSDSLRLQTAFHTWRDHRHRLQLARLCCSARDTGRARAVLQAWHRLAQHVQAGMVARFQARLAQLGSSSSSSSGFYSTSPLSLSPESAGSSSQAWQGGNHGEQSGSLELSGWWNVSVAQRERGCPLLASSALSSLRVTRRCEADHDVEESRELLCWDHDGPRPISPRRLKAVVLSVLGRIRHPALATTFSQWRSFVSASREMRQRADRHSNTRRRTGLRHAFRTWRGATVKHSAAARHRDGVLLTHSVAVWRGVVCDALQRTAEHFHQTRLLTRCFSTWQRKRTLKPQRCDPERAALLRRRAAWLERTTDARRLSCSFSLWAARVRQSQAVNTFYTHTLLNRVFAAWDMYEQFRRERKAVAVSQLQRRLCREAFSQWRLSTAQQQEAYSSREQRLHQQAREAFSQWRLSTAQQQEAYSSREQRLHQQARESLQLWSTYTHNKCGLRLLLSECVEGRERAVMRRALLIWEQRLEDVRKAQDSHQRSIKSRFLQQWRWLSQRGLREQGVFRALEVLRARRRQQETLSLWRQQLRRLREQGVFRALEVLRARRRQQEALSLWRQQLRRVRRGRERLGALVSRAAARWRRRSLLARAESHHSGRLLALSLLQWSWSLARRERARAAAGALEFQQLTLRAQLRHTFTRWSRAHQLTVRSSTFHTERQCRRVLLSWHGVTVTAQRLRYREAWFTFSSEERLLGRGFSRWRAGLLRARRGRAALDLRLSQHSAQRAAKALQCWRTATRDRTAQKQLNRGLLRKCFARWQERSSELRAADLFSAHRERRVAQLALQSWLAWARGSKGRRQMEEAVRLWIEGRRVSTTFHQWLAVYHRHANTHLLHRMFQAWQMAAEETREVCQAVEARRCRLHIQSAFSTWRRTAASHKAVRLLAQRVREAQERRLLGDTLRVWHQEVQACRWRSLYLCDQYFCHWVQQVWLRRPEEENQLQAKLRERCVRCVRRWRSRVLERRTHRRLTQLYWDCWKSQTVAALLLRERREHTLLQRAWLSWRRRRIRTRVSVAYAANLNSDLLAQVFSVWRDRALCRAYGLRASD